MRSFSRISGLAILFIVLLRLSIGWQFLYEGLWKMKTYQSANPWTAAGYLKNAQGPFRDHFRNMAGDPDDLNWLDYDHVASTWDRWQSDFETFYQLTDSQKGSLNRLLNGSSYFTAELPVLPEKVAKSEDFKRLEKFIKYDGDRKILVVDGTWHLVPKDKQRLLGIVGYDESEKQEKIEKGETTEKDYIKGFSEEEQDYIKAVDKVFQRSSRLSFKEKLAATLKADPEYVGKEYRLKGVKDPVEKQEGQIEQYKELLARYHENSKKVEQDFQVDHLNTQWKEIQQKRAELVGPVKALDAELKDKALNLLTTLQLRTGNMPLAKSQINNINLMTIGSLFIFGILLLMGLFTRLAAIGGAGMLLMFYLAFPPWPGVPPAPGPEHSFIVNKNMIEALALIMIATLPTGQWFGLDRVLYCIFKKPKKQ